MHRTTSALVTVGIAATLALAPSLAAQRPVLARPRLPGAEKTAAPAPTSAAAAVAPAEPAARTRGTYRVSVTGFTVNSETYDDPLQLDGKRDEVYVSAEVMSLDRNNKALVPGAGAVRSRVFGDVGGMFGGRDGHNGRVRAGSASPQGGLRTGDSYPGAQPWRLGGQPTGDMLPLELWRGELVKGENAVLVTPTLWEYDQPDLREAYRSWADWAGQTTTRLRDTPEFMAFVTSAFGPEAPVFVSLASLGSSISLSFMNELGKMGDRPIGMTVAGAMQGERATFTFEPRTLLLTMETAERLLGQSVGGKGPGVVAIGYKENHPKLNGDYTVYLLVERMP